MVAAIVRNLNRAASTSAVQVIERVPVAVVVHSGSNLMPQQAKLITAEVTLSRWFDGSSGWTRTSNPPVNRLAQVMFLGGSLLV